MHRTVLKPCLLHRVKKLEKKKKKKSKNSYLRNRNLVLLSRLLVIDVALLIYTFLWTQIQGMWSQVNSYRIVPSFVPSLFSSAVRMWRRRGGRGLRTWFAISSMISSARTTPSFRFSRTPSNNQSTPTRSIMPLQILDGIALDPLSGDKCWERAISGWKSFSSVNTFFESSPTTTVDPNKWKYL